MTKKRGANSPMESERTKQSTSAAASTLGMAAMLSAVSSVFSNNTNDESSQNSESEEEYSQATGGDANLSSSNPWNNENLSKSQVRSPKKANQAGRVEPLFDFHHDGAWRDEIEVEIQTKNKKKFTGTITPIEAKHQIYIGGMGFDDHSNFDGVRINFKGRLIVTFKLLKPINIDELDAVEHFNFTRVSTANGKKFEDVIGCRIKGIRYRPMMVSSLDNEPKPDGTKVVKIEGCEYRVPKEEILRWLAHYGQVTSELEEDCFREETPSMGTNRTGNYTVMMKLDRPIPQLLPMWGRRVKMYHAGIQKLCTHCFGHHKKQFCQSTDKVPWTQYVREFINENTDFEEERFGKWIDILQRVGDDSNRTLTYQQTKQASTPNETEQAKLPNTPPNGENTTPEQVEIEPDTVNNALILEEPKEEDFEIPTTKEAYESMIDRFKTVGLSKTEADEAIKNRTTAYNKACREHKKKMIERKKQEAQKNQTRGRRGSLKKQ